MNFRGGNGRPWAAEVVKKHGEISLAGKGYPTPSNQCWPGGVPYVETIFDEGTEHFVLLVGGVEERTDVTMIADGTAGEMDTTVASPLSEHCRSIRPRRFGRLP